MIKKGKWESLNLQLDRLEEAESVILQEDDKYQKIKVGLVKDMVSFVDQDYISYGAYFPKYERFLRSNNIYYEYYDVFAHDWLEKAKKFDVIIWHTDSTPSEQVIAKNKIYTLNKFLGKKTLPSFEEIWAYEDKVNAHYLYTSYQLPSINTFVTHSKSDAIEFINKIKFPIISKITTGSASNGVVKITGKAAALRFINDVFSVSGKKTYIAGYPQKDYIYFQDFIKADYDLRIIVIGNKLFGYYRYPNENDFRASGAGNYVKKEIPYEALELAFRVKEVYTSTCLAVDLLYDKAKGQYLIIETSIFIGVESSEQLVVNGTPGYYKRLGKGEYEFHAGRYWVQELALEDFFTSQF